MTPPPSPTTTDRFAAFRNPYRRHSSGSTSIGMKKPVSHIIGMFAISLVLAAPGWCHVLSAGQMLEPFLKATRKIRTVTIDMETTIHDTAYGTGSIEERLVIGQGGRFRAERRFPEGDTVLLQDGRKSVLRGIERPHPGARRIDTVFPTIFFQKSLDDFLNALNFLGVDTHTVGMDRIGRQAVFVIGTGLETAPGSRLWIERERRIPLRFVGVGVSDGVPVVLRAEYGAYRQVDEDLWLPGTIEYYRDDLPWVVSILRHISLNDRLSETLFRASERGETGSPVPDFLNIKD